MIQSPRADQPRESQIMKIDVVTSGAPRPLANYSEAMVAGPWIFAAG
jgi:hypothetical protein